MALLDILKQLGQVGIQGGQALGNAMQAQGNPLAFTQQQENLRQQKTFLDQLQLQQQITPYQQAVLDQQKQAHIDQANQQLFENRRQLAQGIASGDFDPNSTVNNIIASPNKKGGLFTITPDSDIGKALNLTQNQQIPMEDAVRYGLQFAEKKEAATQKAATGQIIEDARQQGHQEIDEQFTPDRYQRLYGAVDPDLDRYKKEFHSQLDTAAATDKKQGNTTQIDQFFKQLRDHKSPWETEQLKARDVKRDAVDKRNDQSFQFNTNELNRERKPIDDMAGRMGRLRDTVNARTPVGDPLVPAELLTVMAGGMGSGLRINEAEINRAVGGRSHWESLRAALQKWSTDPSKALDITDVQRGQLNKLLDVVQSKIQKKQDIFGEAENSLVNGTSPFVHRRAMMKMHHDLEGVDRLNIGVPEIGSPYGGKQ